MQIIERLKAFMVGEGDYVGPNGPQLIEFDLNELEHSIDLRDAKIELQEEKFEDISDFLETRFSELVTSIQDGARGQEISIELDAIRYGIASYLDGN